MAHNNQPYNYVSLEDNSACEIDNPVAHKSLEQLDQEARDFSRRVNPNGQFDDLFVKAARIARDPPNWETVRGITPDEKDALRAERKLGFWKQPKTLRVTIATLCIAATIQGWTQTGGNTANQTWPTQLGLQDKNSPKFRSTSATWAYAGVNAIVYLAASIFGAGLSDPLQSMILGRRGALFVSACLSFASVIGAACSTTWQQLFACRAILGLGMGAKASVTPIYGAEVSPAHLRGSLVMNWQLFDAFGIFLGFTASLIVAKVGDLAWRFQMASAFLPAVCLLSLIWAIPESPRWLLKQGRLSEAFSVTCSLRATPLQAAVELFYANAQVQAEVSLLPNQSTDSEMEAQNSAPSQPRNQSLRHRGRDFDRSHRPGQNENGLTPERMEKDHQHSSQGTISERFLALWNKLTNRVDEADLDPFQRHAKYTSYWVRIWQLLRDKRTRRAAIASMVVMISQQLCGVNVLQFYSSTFFSDVNTKNNKSDQKSNMDALWLSWGIGVANFIFTFPAYHWIDKRGRRFLLMVTYPGMTISLLAACLSFMLPVENNSRIAVLGFWSFLFIFFYSWGQGPVPFAYSSEVFPLLNREAGMSFAVFVNLFGAGCLTLFVPRLTEALSTSPDDTESGKSRLLGIFAGLNVFALILIFFFVPETAGATIGKEEGSLNYISLEELNYIFSVPTRKHISYQVRHVVPWALRRVQWAFQTYVLRREVEKPRDPHLLYTWVDIRNIERERQRTGGVAAGRNDSGEDIGPHDQPELRAPGNL